MWLDADVGSSRSVLLAVVLEIATAVAIATEDRSELLQEASVNLVQPLTWE